MPCGVNTGYPIMPVAAEITGTFGVFLLPPLGQIASMLPLMIPHEIPASLAHRSACVLKEPEKYAFVSVALTPLFSNPKFICRARPDMMVATSVEPGKLDGGALITASAKPLWHPKTNGTSGCAS